MNIKAFLPIISLLFFSACANKGGSKSTPEKVRTAFAALQPTVKQVHWEFENGNYEAEFKQNQIETSLLFDEDGKLLETEVAIADSLLPATAQTYIKEHYSGKKITEMARITDFTNKVIYEVEINGFDVLFDSSGSFITSIKN